MFRNHFKNRIVFLALTAITLGSLLSGCGKESKIDALKYIRLGEYKGLSVERPSTEISEDLIDEQIELMMSAYSVTEEVSDRDDVREGDIVNIDFVGTHNGIVFDGGSAQGYNLAIGSGTFIDGFESGLVGAKVGDNLDLNLKFPNVYPNDPSLAGEDVVFNVTINSINVTTAQELTDEFVSDNTNGQITSISELREMLREQLEHDAVSYADNMVYSTLLSQAIDNAVLLEDIPDSFIEEKKEEMIRTMKSNAMSYGIDYQTYLNQYLGISEAEFLNTIEESSVEIAMQNLVIHAIAQTENISISKEELNEQLDKYMDYYGYSSRKELEKNMNIDDVKESLLIVKVEQFLADNGVVTEVE